MGGRGASGGLRGGGAASIAAAVAAANGQRTVNGGLQAIFSPGYDANQNQNVVKFQGQDDDKTARYLAKVNNEIDVSAYPDVYTYYPGSFQKWSLAMGLNDKPQVMPDAQFDQMVAKNNLQVLYRGESGQPAVDRLINSQYSHTGIGSYGDGFYFTENAGIANRYAQSKGGTKGMVTKMVLSPNARAITYSDLVNKMAQASGNLQRGLSRAGKDSKTKYLNDGEAQYALKLGYNVVTMGNGYHYAVTRDAFIISDKVQHKW